MKTMLKIAAMLCVTLLTACASGSGSQGNDVQDIKPGEKSIIQPPSVPAPQAPAIEEKAL